MTAVGRWASRLDPQIQEQAQAMLECLWVFEEHRTPNMELLKRLLQAHDGRIRAAAIRTLGHWADKVKDWQPILMAAARDENGLVRAEAVKAAVEFEGVAAAEVVFEVASRKLDPEMNTVLNYARNNLKVDTIVREIITSGKPLSPAARKYVLANASVNDLLTMDKAEDVYRAILDRKGVPTKRLNESLAGLAKMVGESELSLLMDLMKRKSQQGGDTNLDDLAVLLAAQPVDRLQQRIADLRQLATDGPSPTVRQAGYAGWILAESGKESSFAAASKSKSQLRDYLLAIPMVPDPKVRDGLYDQVHPILFELPGHSRVKPTRGWVNREFEWITLNRTRPTLPGKLWRNWSRRLQASFPN